MPKWLARCPDLYHLERIKKNGLCRTLLKHTGHMVFGGPFCAMKLAEDLDLAWDPKFIVGSYEEEVHDVINDVICAAPTRSNQHRCGPWLLCSRARAKDRKCNNYRL